MVKSCITYISNTDSHALCRYLCKYQLYTSTALTFKLACFVYHRHTTHYRGDGFDLVLLTSSVTTFIYMHVFNTSIESNSVHVNARMKQMNTPETNQFSCIVKQNERLK